IKPNIEHYTCLVDVLGRSGRLEEAENLINKMESPDIITWKALLGACRLHNDVERAKRISENIIKLDPKDASTYVLLGNIYSSVGRSNDKLDIQRKMKDYGIKENTWKNMD